MTKLEDVARAVHAAYLQTATRLGWSVKPHLNVNYEELDEPAQELDRSTARAAITAYDTEPSAEEIEAAARAIHEAYDAERFSWDEPGIDHDEYREDARLILVAARRIRLAQLEEKKK